MSKIKPYHEPLEAEAYVLEIGDTTNSSHGEPIELCMNEYSSQNTNHHYEESSHSKIPCKFYEEQKVVSKYLLHNQIEIPFEQQKWVASYTIIRIHDDDTIEIKTILQKELGRWRSTKFLPHNWVNPDQVITFDQDIMKIFTSPDYDEVHHKMLECYLIQSLRIETHDELLIKSKPTIMIKNYHIQPLPKGTSNERLTNGVQTMET